MGPHVALLSSVLSVMIQGGVEGTAGSEYHTHSSFFIKRSTGLGYTSNDVGGMNTRLCLSASPGSGHHTGCPPPVAWSGAPTRWPVCLPYPPGYLETVSHPGWFVQTVEGSGPTREGNGTTQVSGSGQRMTRLEQGVM